MWKIEKKYKSKMAFTDKKPNLGKEIDVFVKSIGVVHKEYLVNFKFVDALMESYGFEKVLRKPFEEFYNELMEGKNVMNLSPEELQKNVEKVKLMSEDEKRFSFLSTSFIYKKVANSSNFNFFNSFSIFMFIFLLLLILLSLLFSPLLLIFSISS